MQYTTHYNLNLPEGTDIVNPLIQDNPNYSAIDTALYDNKLRVIGTATELATGTSHALTRADQDISAFKFVATSDYNTGDTFTVDGVTVTARRADGSAMKNKAYVINSTVLCVLDGTILNILNVDGVVASDNVTYNNSSSGLGANTVKGAIDELANTKVTLTSGIVLQRVGKLRILEIGDTAVNLTSLTLSSGDRPSDTISEVIDWYGFIGLVRVRTDGTFYVGHHPNYGDNTMTDDSTSGASIRATIVWFV